MQAKHNIASMGKISLLNSILVVLLCAIGNETQANLLNIFGKSPWIKKGYNGDVSNPLDTFLLDIVPLLFGAPSNNENGTKSESREYLMTDESNDDAARLTGQELIVRSGFKYELYEAVADDGYVTQLTRIINPLANRKYLRQPPILMEHGGTIDITGYLIASSIQHFPEKWPRTRDDGPMQSWNRSLAFVLANNGFDVWLAETRGSNDNNKKYIPGKALESIVKGSNLEKNMTISENFEELSHERDYWSFSQDDIIAHELKSHMDAVMKVTGSTKLSVMTFSLSTPTSLAFLSTRPDYAKMVNAYISMAPMVSGQGQSKLVRFLFKGLCPYIPEKIGSLIFSDMLLSQPTRELIILISKNKDLRYSLVKAFITLIMGPSAKYQTLLDLNVMGHMLRQLSFKELKQLCQQTSSNRLQKYDYGFIKNKMLYGSEVPPLYDISNLAIEDWILVSASNDILSTPEVVEHLLKIVNPKPLGTFVAPNFNHLDLIAGLGNDIYVNKPILAYLENKSIITGSYIDNVAVSSSRAFDVSSLLPKDLKIDLGNITKPLKELTKSIHNVTSKVDPVGFLDTLQKNINQALDTIENLFKAHQRKLKKESGKEAKKDDLS